MYILVGFGVMQLSGQSVSCILLTESQFPHLHHEDINYACLTGIFVSSSLDPLRS